MSVKHKYESNDFVRTEIRPKSISFDKLVDPATPNLCKYWSAPTRRENSTTATITMLTVGWVGKNSSRQRVTQLVFQSGYIEDLKLRASESGKAVALKEKLTLSYDKSELAISRSMPRGGREPT